MDRHGGSSSGKAREFYDRESPTYESTRNTPAFLHVRKAESLLFGLLPEPVLDMGSGTGMVARDSGKDFVAMDISPAMLSRNPSRKRIVGNALSLPFPDSSFPAISCLLMTANVIGMEVFGEIRRVLKPGGLCLLSAEVAERAGIRRRGDMEFHIFPRNFMPEGFSVAKRFRLFRLFRPSWRYLGIDGGKKRLLEAEWFMLSNGLDAFLPEEWHAEVVLLRKNRDM